MVLMFCTNVKNVHTCTIHYIKKLITKLKKKYLKTKKIIFIYIGLKSME